MNPQNNPQTFTGKTVLITGASGGIGRATAQAFAQAGAKVAVHYNRGRERAQETLASLAGEGHLTAQADLTDEAAVARLVAESVAGLGHIDILVNNAGLYQDHPAAEVSYAAWQSAWREIIGLNLLGAANASYCVAQHMIERGGGRIVNVSSRGAFRGEPTAPAYGASKAGLNAFSQSLAKYLAPYQIFVTAVAPGFVETEMAQERLNSPAGEEIRRQSPLNRVAYPQEVAHTILFLASEGSEFLTGAIIDVNGASYLRT